MPFVHVHWFEGRTDEQKAEIARRIEAALIGTGARRMARWGAEPVT